MAGPSSEPFGSWEAGEAIGQYLFCKLVTGEILNVCDTQGEKALGVCQENITSGDATNGRIANVQLFGVSRVIAGATIAIFDELTVGADARAEVAATGDRVVGIALQAAVDGDHMDVLLVPAGRIV